MPLPWIKPDDDRRCEALSRASGYQRCGNPKAFNSRTACRYHGAHRVKRNGRLNSNYRTGEYTREALKKSKEQRQELRFLGKLVEISNLQCALEKLRRKQKTSAEIGYDIKLKIERLMEVHGVPSDSDQSIAE